MKINSFEYSIGNSKIGRDTIIFNMTSATDCPSKKRGQCKHCSICYAMKSERQYPQVLPFRRRQAAYWQSVTDYELIKDFAAALTKHKRTVKYVRFSEAGDITDQECIRKWAMLARSFPTITFYGYTAAKDLKKHFKALPDNLIFCGSSFMLSNNFSPYHKKWFPWLWFKKLHHCPMDCSSCTLCKTKGKKYIKVAIH